MSESRSRFFVAIVALLTLLVSACREEVRSPSPPSAAFEGQDLHVQVVMPEGAAREGENELRFRIRDASGAPVDDARVVVAYSMPMAGMATMGGKVSADPIGQGEYRAEVMLDMAGTWLLQLDAARPSGEVAHIGGSLRTGAPGMRLDKPAAAAGLPKNTAIAGEVRVDPLRLQQIGVRFASAERTPLERIIRGTGTVAWDETKLVDVSLKVRGWVRELFADVQGARVAAGDPLFTVYSPELYAAQFEYLQALRAQTAARATAAPDRADGLVRAARARLRLWNLAEPDVAALAARGEPLEAVPVRAPASGFLLEKNVVAGGAIEPGMRLFRIAPLDRVWIDAQVFESDAPLLKAGQPAVVRAPTLPSGGVDARVAYVYPSLDAGTRTVRARLELPNPDLAFRPGMWVEVELRADLGPRLHVPASAVIYAGARRVVFVDRGEGRLEPRNVETGVTTGEAIEILSGLEPGERVVAAGNFLIAAESRLQSALEQW
jgi:Cu(I)/Ag(I) efflux system membrane fusion protein